MTKHKTPPTETPDSVADLKRRFKEAEVERDHYRELYLEATKPAEPPKPKKKRSRGPKPRKELILRHIVARMAYLFIELRDPAVRNNSSEIARLLSVSEYAKSIKKHYVPEYLHQLVDQAIDLVIDNFVPPGPDKERREAAFKLICGLRGWEDLVLREDGVICYRGWEDSIPPFPGHPWVRRLRPNDVED